jgi:nucleoside-diphosphate-sugar epimerase
VRVAVVGFGYVGSTLASRLTVAGHQVFGVRRSPVARQDVVSIQADVTNRESLTAVPVDLDHVVYAISPGARVDEAYRRAYPEGLANLLDAVPTARFTFVSSTAVYPQKNGETVNESSTTEATNFSSQRLLEAESLLAANSGRHTIVRASGIYGPGRTRLVSQLVTRDLDLETRTVFTSRVHRDDLASCLHFLIDSRSAEGVYIASDPHPTTLGEMQDWVRERQALLQLPEAPQAETSLASGRANRRIVPERLLQEGFDFTYPSFREGYSAILSSTSSDE